MAVGDSLPALTVFTLVESYFLQRTVFVNEAFRTVCLGALGVNLVLLGLWSSFIYPYFLNPLRHLPTIPVCVITPKCSHRVKIGAKMKGAIMKQGSHC